MSPPPYYLVNHSKHEFSYFDNIDKSIFAELERTYTSYGWSNTDDIRINSEPHPDMLWTYEHLVNDMEYRNVDDEANNTNISSASVSVSGGYKVPRRFSKAYCKKTACNKMGFTQRASCRPYKNCYTKTRRSSKK
jgi:hypothetical protein